jgi:soluble lytic murein transglycosylase
LSAYGDPRDRGVDAVDWIETIPFAETRNYVQRVLENLQIYRHRLNGKTEIALSLEQDLSRSASQ